MKHLASVLLTALLHVAVLAVIEMQHARHALEEGRAADQSDDPRVLVLQLHGQDRSSGSLAGISTDKAQPACTDSYVGVGMLLEPTGLGRMRIRQIPLNTPAWHAGLRPGDVLVNDEILGANRYPAGTLLHVRYLRDQASRIAAVVVGLVCDEGPSYEGHEGAGQMTKTFVDEHT